jgi:hypothetical protein
MASGVRALLEGMALTGLMLAPASADTEPGVTVKFRCLSETPGIFLLTLDQVGYPPGTEVEFTVLPERLRLGRLVAPAGLTLTGSVQSVFRTLGPHTMQATVKQPPGEHLVEFAVPDCDPSPAKLSPGAVACQQAIGRVTRDVFVRVHLEHSRCLEAPLVGGQSCNVKRRDLLVQRSLAAGRTQLARACQEARLREIGFHGPAGTVYEGLLQDAVTAALSLIHTTYATGAPGSP